MAVYRFLVDAFIVDRLYEAGTVAATSDVGGTLPSDFAPPAACEPLDASALTAFYAQGPQQLEQAVRNQFTGTSVALPVTYWKATAIPGSGAMAYTLTGLGTNLPAVNE